MKCLFTKIIFAGLMLSLIPSMSEAIFPFYRQTERVKSTPTPNNGLISKISVNLSSMKNYVYNTSTETKILVGLGAVAAIGIGYLVYRAYNPTDKEIIAAAQVKINTAQNIVNLVPVSEPLDEQGLQSITTQLTNNRWHSPTALRRHIQQSINDLHYHRTVIVQRIERYQQANQYEPIDLDTKSIDALIPQLQARLDLINTHSQYFTLDMTRNKMNNKYSEALKNQNDMQKLVPIIRRSEAQFPFLAYIQSLKRDAQIINTDLAQYTQTPPNYASIYTALRTALTRIASGLEVIQNTILTSNEFSGDQKRKDEYDAEKRKLAIERQRIAQEQERIRIEQQKAANEDWARQEDLRIKREKLELEKQKLALAQQQAGQQ